MNLDPDQRARLHDELAIRSYITQKLAPFDDYQFADRDEQAVARYITGALRR